MGKATDQEFTPVPHSRCETTARPDCFPSLAPEAGPHPCLPQGVSSLMHGRGVLQSWSGGRRILGTMEALDANHFLEVSQRTLLLHGYLGMSPIRQQAFPRLH